MYNKNSVLYAAICSSQSSPGIFKKVNGFVSGANNAGYIAKSKTINPNGFKGNAKLIKNLFFAKEETIIVRYIPKLGIIFLFLGFYLKLKNRRLIIDVPTPMINHIFEIYKSDKSSLARLFSISLITFMGSLPFLSATRIVQYSNESSFFSFLCKKKTIIIGNGVDTKNILQKQSSPLWPDSSLRLVAVGTVAFWHGWDKVIKVIADINNNKLAPYKIHLTIIGEGPDLKNLISLSKKLKVDSFVKFTGFLSGNSLDIHYEDAHYAIGSMGWERVNIDLASPIKTREYLAAGLPVIYSTKDIDLIDDVDKDLAIFVDTSEDNKNLKRVLMNMHLIKIPSPVLCRKFCLSRFDFEQKAKLVLEF